MNSFVFREKFISVNAFYEHLNLIEYYQVLFIFVKCRHCVQRTLKEDGYEDEKCFLNRWKWDWTDRDINGERLGLHIRKLYAAGRAYCVLCRIELSYGKRGITTLTGHIQSKEHNKASQTRKENPTFPGNSVFLETTYGVHPSLLKGVSLNFFISLLV